MEQIAIAILAGGRSRRMGRDKAALPWDGETLLERLAKETLATHCPVFVVGRIRPDDWTLTNVTFHIDRYPDRGPLGGVLTALEATKMAVLAVACDMPRLNAEALGWLLATARDLPNNSPGVAARSGDQIEPLFAVYGQSLRATAETRIAAGQLSLHGMIADAALAIADVPEEIREALVNVNTPEEWRDLEKKDKR